MKESIVSKNAADATHNTTLLELTEEAPIADGVIDVMHTEFDVSKLQATFWQAGHIFCTDKSISLRQVDESDRESFIEIQREYSAFRSMLKDEIYCDMVWKEHTQERGLMCAITKDSTYLGYCGISNITAEPWEITIELKSEWTRQGIGIIAVRAMLDRIKAQLGVGIFKIRIEPSNYVSQKMFEKLGAVPHGIAELWIHDPKMLAQCEEDNLHNIDENLIAVAEKFSVEPRKLLSHVLEYTLRWNNEAD